MSYKIMREINSIILKKMYLHDKKSIRRIAKEFNVGKTTIEYYLKKFKITSEYFKCTTGLANSKNPK